MTHPMPISRELDATKINKILNNPEIRPFIADMKEGSIDISSKVADPNNVLLMGEFGGCFFGKFMEGMYEVHTQVLPEGRGNWTKEFLMAVRHYIFTNTDAVEVITRVPREHKGAKQAAEWVGMKYEFTRPNGCIFGGKLMDVDIYSERLQDWVPTDPYVEFEGEWLHEQMESEAHRLGITTKTHENDPNHNRYVGAALCMMRGGQYQKAVAFYNRWVVASRHMQKGKLSLIKVASLMPPTIEFDEGLLRFKGDSIEIVPTLNTAMRSVA